MKRGSWKASSNSAMKSRTKPTSMASTALSRSRLMTARPSSMRPGEFMPETETAQLYVEVDFNPAVTDAESLATAMDRLVETALSTPDMMADYGNPAVKEFYAVGKQPTRHVTSVQVVDPDSQASVELEVRKTQGGYLVGIDGSYLQQDVGPVYDPCNFGVELEIPNDEEEGADDHAGGRLVET